MNKAPVFGFRIYWLGLLFWMLMISISQAEELALSMVQVLALFYERNPDIIASQYNIDQAHAQEMISAAIPSPTFNVDIEQIAPKNNDRLRQYYGYERLGQSLYELMSRSLPHRHRFCHEGLI